MTVRAQAEVVTAGAQPQGAAVAPPCALLGDAGRPCCCTALPRAAAAVLCQKLPLALEEKREGRKRLLVATVAAGAAAAAAPAVQELANSQPLLLRASVVGGRGEWATRQWQVRSQARRGGGRGRGTGSGWGQQVRSQTQTCASRVYPCGCKQKSEEWEGTREGASEEEKARLNGRGVLSKEMRTKILEGDALCHLHHPYSSAWTQ